MAARSGRADRREGWLLIVVSTAGASSTLRVHIWRKLRALGALYLQQSVALLPDRPALRRAVSRLADRAQREGGELRVLPMSLTDAATERAVIADFSGERTDEYAEVCSRAPEFLAELNQERKRGRTTYTEVEESEADLHRLQTWLAKIQARDYFGAQGADDAVAAVAACAEELAAFESEALNAEIGVEATTPARSRRLRVVED